MTVSTDTHAFSLREVDDSAAIAIREHLLGKSLLLVGLEAHLFTHLNVS